MMEKIELQGNEKIISRYELLSLQIGDGLKGELQSLGCSLCGKFLDDKKWGHAWIKEEGEEKRPVRMCYRCLDKITTENIV